MTHVVLVGVHCFRIKAFFPLLVALLHMLADPDIAIQAKDQVHAAWQGDEVGFETSDEDGRNCHELTIPQLHWYIREMGRVLGATTRLPVA